MQIGVLERPEERDLLAGFRLRTAAAARNAAWITLAGVAALTLPHHSLTTASEHGLVWLLVGVAALGNTATYLPYFGRLLGRGMWPFYGWTCSLLFFDALVVYASHDVDHEVYLIYIPVLLFAVATLEPLPALGVLIAAIGSTIATIAQAGSLSGDLLVGSSLTFVLVWLLGMFFASAQRREIIETASERARAIQRGRELEELNERTEQLNRRLQRAVASVIRAQERERRRIGRELHDEPVQSLSTASMRLGALQEELARDAGMDSVRTRIGDVRSLLIDVLWEIRKMIVALRPSDLDDLGLVAAVSAFARGRLDEAGVMLEIDARGRREGRLPGEVETALFRIAQEAVTNIARHAHARHAWITFREADGVLQLRVDDDGIGFITNGTPARSNGEGFGLEGMRERASLIGGELAVSSRDGGGTSVRLAVPVAEGAETP